LLPACHNRVAFHPQLIRVGVKEEMAAAARPFHVVIWGATGYTGEGCGILLIPRSAIRWECASNTVR
jgi:hypothetical protein